MLYWYFKNNMSLLKKVSDNSYQCYIYNDLICVLYSYDCHLSILDKLWETIRRFYVNFSASSLGYLVKDFARIFNSEKWVTFISINYNLFLPLMESFAGTGKYWYQTFLDIPEWSDHIETYYETVRRGDLSMRTLWLFYIYKTIRTHFLLYHAYEK